MNIQNNSSQSEVHSKALNLVPTMQNRLMSARQIAEFLGFSERHISNLAKSRRIPRIKIGRSVRFDPSSVLEAMKSFEKRLCDNAISKYELTLN